MKKIFKILSAAFFVLVILQACKKSNAGNNLPAPVYTIISQAIIDSMEKWGMAINKGTTPPVLNGIYFAHPYICFFDNSGDNLVGRAFADYTYKFSNQNSAAFTIRVDYKDTPNGSDTGSDVTATYIAGNGNAFTIFAELNGSESGVKYTALSLFSGVIQPDGIQHFQSAYYLKSKAEDPFGLLMNVGSSRILYDSDDLSESLATYLMEPTINESRNTNVMPGAFMRKTQSAASDH